jgi:hypothetical protein
LSAYLSAGAALAAVLIPIAAINAISQRSIPASPEIYIVTSTPAGGCGRPAPTVF